MKWVIQFVWRDFILFYFFISSDKVFFTVTAYVCSRLYLATAEENVSFDFSTKNLWLRYNWTQTICLNFSLHSSCTNISRINVYFYVPHTVVIMVNFMSTWLHHGVHRINIISRCICDGVGISGFSKLNSPSSVGGQHPDYRGLE